MKLALEGWRERARLRRRELAAIAGVSCRTIDRAIAAGRIAAVRDGRLTFVPIAAALAYLGEAQPPARPQAQPPAAPSSAAAVAARRILARRRAQKQRARARV